MFDVIRLEVPPGRRHQQHVTHGKHGTKRRSSRRSSFKHCLQSWLLSDVIALAVLADALGLLALLELGRRGSRHWGMVTCAGGTSCNC